MERKRRGRHTHQSIEMHRLALTATPRLVPCPWQLSHEPKCAVHINSTKLRDSQTKVRVCVCVRVNVRYCTVTAKQSRNVLCKA